MLLVWGSGGGQAVLGDLPEENCTACGEKTAGTALVVYRYWHLWYLFSFLVSREYFKVCAQCGAVVPYDKTEAKLTFPKDNIPFIRKRGWLVVAALIVFFILIGAIGSWRSKSAIAAMLAEPKVMDLYYADLSRVANSGYRQGGTVLYGVMALIEAREDGTYQFATSTRAFGKKSLVARELKEGSILFSYDEDAPIVFSREELESLLHRNIIYDGKRQPPQPPAVEAE